MYARDISQKEAIWMLKCKYNIRGFIIYLINVYDSFLMRLKCFDFDGILIWIRQEMDEDWISFQKAMERTRVLFYFLL